MRVTVRVPSPSAAGELPDVGYIRQLSPEGVLSVNPDMIIALEGFGPPEAASVIKQAGILVVVIPDGYDNDLIIRKIWRRPAPWGAKRQAKSLLRKRLPNWLRHRLRPRESPTSAR